MITDKEIPNIISFEVPDFARQDKEVLQVNPENSKQIFNLFSHFTDYTICEIKNHEWGHVKRCFQFATSIYNQGSMVAREAIENIFFYRISTLIDMTEDRDHVIEILPSVFKNLRLQHVNAYGN